MSINAFLIGKVTELDKTTLGDIAIWKIDGLSKKELLKKIKSKDRNTHPVQKKKKKHLNLEYLQIHGNLDKVYQNFSYMLKRNKYEEYRLSDIEYLVIQEIEVKINYEI